MIRMVLNTQYIKSSELASRHLPGSKHQSVLPTKLRNHYARLTSSKNSYNTRCRDHLFRTDLTKTPPLRPNTAFSSPFQQRDSPQGCPLSASQQRSGTLTRRGGERPPLPGRPGSRSRRAGRRQQPGRASQAPPGGQGRAGQRGGGGGGGAGPAPRGSVTQGRSGRSATAAPRPASCGTALRFLPAGRGL